MTPSRKTGLTREPGYQRAEEQWRMEMQLR